MRLSHHRFLVLLGVLYGIWWSALAIDPVSRADWALENVLVLLFVLGLFASYRWFMFSRTSMALIFLFLCLHSIGSHYTYSMVPYDEWFQVLTGTTFNDLMGWHRNHFDRLAHLAYGLLLAYPIREVFLRIADVKGFWGYFLPLDVTISTSAIYELIEWAAAEIFGGELGMQYLGTQGDVWDAHRDMALASFGAFVAMSVTAFINMKLQRDFASEWAESLRIKRREPLGESSLMRMLRQRKKP